MSDTILVIDDDSSIRRSFTSVLEPMGLKVITSGTGEKARSLVEKGDISLVFLDLRLPDINGIEILNEIKSVDPRILIIIITGYATLESAVESMRLGAYDYIKKPFKSDTIKVITKLALEKLALSRRVELLCSEKDAESSNTEIIGSCDAMVSIGKKIAKVASADTTVLIEGESGTGKELIANLVHRMSTRSSGPLVHINCSAIPENLLESEFFGYEKGAFTGAANRRRGLIEQAQKGVLHLDEVGDMPQALQAKLLRLLEERRFRRVGGTEEITADIRVVASTNKDLLQEVEKGKFRLDLYYRLNAFRIRVPPLRERGQDIILLADYWIKKNNANFGKNVKGVSAEAQELLLSYSWPGNVRELKNIIERTMLLLPAETMVLLPENIPLDPSSKPREVEALSAALRPEFNLDEGLDYHRVTDNITNQVKKRIIERALQLTGGNKSKASKVLRISRPALLREIEKLRQWNGKACPLSEQ